MRPELGATIANPRGVRRAGLTLLAFLSLGPATACTSTGGATPSPQDRWIQQQGGLVAPSLVERRLLDRVVAELEGVTGVPDLQLRARVVEDDDLGAWSWPDGSLYLTRGLLSRVDEDGLRAVLAHEVGHLVDVGGRRVGSRDEHRADRVGCVLLARLGRSSMPMGRVLSLLRSAQRPSFEIESRYTAMHRRYVLRVPVESTR